MKLRTLLVALLRKTHLLALADSGRFLHEWWRMRASNRKFRAEHPDFVTPPAWLAYDAYSVVNCGYYYWTGKEQAKYLADRVQQHHGGDAVSLCEWGCGPGRIIRHLPENLHYTHQRVIGADYNKKSIAWCNKHLPGIEFIVNDLSPPFPLQDNELDCLYSISVFTHLSQAMHEAWAKELRRVVKPGGLILFSTHGNECRDKLTDAERKQFDADQLVVRGGVKEGKRCFVAYHPQNYIRQQLFAGCEVLEHIEQVPLYTFFQDLWVIRNGSG